MSFQLTFRLRLSFLVLTLLATSGSAMPQEFIPTNDPPQYGPYNASFMPDGEGLKKALLKDDTVLRADSPWTLSCWAYWSEAPNGPALLAGVGNTDSEYSRFLGIDGDKAFLFTGKDRLLSGSAAFQLRKWHFLAATFDGKEFQLFADGNRIAVGAIPLGRVAPVLQIAPVKTLLNGSHFGGKIAGLTLKRQALNPDDIRTVFEKTPNFPLILFEEGSKPWPVQTSGQAGYRAPQDPGTLPHTSAPFSKPEKKNVVASTNTLEPNGKNEFTIQGGWRLRPAPDVKEPGEAISLSEFSTREWWPATVPGTVLTTMVDQGIYPDPDYGLNNLAIPESLNKQDYWYRTEFNAPNDWKGRRLTLTFEGINYAAAVWLNGKQVGTIKGAFIRGMFDITNALKLGQSNVLAVRVSPPPHPGIPHEQSLKGGAGENGGIMCLGWSHLRGHRGLGLDARDPRPRHGYLATRDLAGDRCGPYRRSAGRQQTATAANQSSHHRNHGARREWLRCRSKKQRDRFL